MFQDSQKIMIVKGAGKEKEYAHLLSQLISKIPNVVASQPITESEYNTSFTTINNTPKVKVIFFGSGKEAETQGKSVNWKYDRFGMKYGWLGKRCVIMADPDGISLKEQSAFADYYNSRIEQLKSIIEDIQAISYSKTETVGIVEFGEEIRWKDEDEVSDKVKKTLTAVKMAPPILFLKGMKGASDIIENTRATYERTELWKRQYELLLCEFVLNGFEQFMSNISDKFEKDQMFIVYDEKDAEYAHLLHNLIQQYSGYDVAAFTEKMFTDNVKDLDSTNKLIFLGNTKAAEERSLAVKYTFDESGMRFGWKGNHAFINVKKLKNSEVEGFISMYSQKSKDFEDQAKEYIKPSLQLGRGVTTILTLASLPCFALPGLVLRTGMSLGVEFGAWKILNNANTLTDLLGYQYQLVLREFVFNGLDKFMEA